MKRIFLFNTSQKEAMTNSLLLNSVLTNIHEKPEERRYHAAPKGTLVTDALFTGPAENTQLLMVGFTSVMDHNSNPSEISFKVMRPFSNREHLFDTVGAKAHVPVFLWLSYMLAAFELLERFF